MNEDLEHRAACITIAAFDWAAEAVGDFQDRCAADPAFSEHWERCVEAANAEVAQLLFEMLLAYNCA